MNRAVREFGSILSPVLTFLFGEGELETKFRGSTDLYGFDVTNLRQMVQDSGGSRLYPGASDYRSCSGISALNAREVE